MGTKTLNDIFYKPDIGASGAVEKGKFDDGLDVADGLIEGNKPANNKLSAFAATTSAELAGVISDEEGSGKVVLNDSPVFTTKITTPIIDLTGGQVVFPAIVNPSADVNTLDDYEEGTWTPILKFGGASVDMTGTFIGLYTKIGRLVTFTGRLTLTVKGSSTGNAAIGGLPFTCKDDAAASSPLTTAFAGKITFANILVGYVITNTNLVYFYEVTEAGVDTAITNADFADDSWMFFSGIYFTD